VTKAEYLEKLNQKLRVLPKSERCDALEYYDGCISDSESEEEAIMQLGTPGEVAANILAHYVERGNSSARMPHTISDERTPGATGSSGMKTALVIILALFALPVGLPIVIAIAAVAFTLFVALCAIVFAVAVAGISLLVTGIVALLAFPRVIFQSLGLAVSLFGIGLMSLGLGILLIKSTTILMRGFPKISRFVSKKIIRRSSHGR